MIQVRNVFSAFVLFSCLMIQDSLCKVATSIDSSSIPASSAVSGTAASAFDSPAAPLVEKARFFVQETGQEILSILQDKKTSKQIQEDKFRAMLRKRFDLKAIGFFALGRYRRDATAAEKHRFLKLFEDVTVESYASQFKHYSDEHLKILEVREPDHRGGILAISNVIRAGRKPLSVHWKVFLTKKQGWRVLDLVIEGVSQSLTHRKEYAELINQRKNGVSGLNEALQEQVDKYNKADSTPPPPLSWKAIPNQHECTLFRV